MQEYLDFVQSVLTNGSYKPNRTALDTVSSFSEHYTVDVSDGGFPLLTTKDLGGSRWESLTHEFLWYLSGEEHIRTLRDHTKIWDQWSNEEGHLDTAYGRFWRRYPVPDESSHLPGEEWATDDSAGWVHEEDGNYVVDQLAYAVHQLKNNPQSRRIVCSAWHPGNATTSLLPPCHFTFVFNVQGDELNLHLTQRSGDTAVGIPFNIASYALLMRVVANQVPDLKPGTFSHTVVDAHIYCGSGDRGEWYGDNLGTIQDFVEDERFEDALEYIEENAPEEENNNEDHIPNLLVQLQREPRDRPTLDISDDATIDSIDREDIKLSDYDPYDSLQFFVAE